MARETAIAVELGALGRADVAVGIMAGEATEPAVARLETRALSEAIGMVVDFKPVELLVHVVVVGVKHILVKGLTRAIGIVRPAENPHEAFRIVDGLQMALHAHVVAELRVESGWIDDGLANLGERRLRIDGDSNVRGGRPVAALAADAVGKLLRKHRRLPDPVAALGNLRVRIVTEHAAALDPPGPAGMIGHVIARTHAPASALCIPAQRELIQFARRVAIQVGARMKA